MELNDYECEVILALRELMARESEKTAEFWKTGRWDFEMDFEARRAQHWLNHLCLNYSHGAFHDDEVTPWTQEEIVQSMIDLDSDNLKEYLRDPKSVILFCIDAPDRDPWRAVRNAPGTDQARALFRAQWKKMWEAETRKMEAETAAWLADQQRRRAAKGVAAAR